MLGLLFTKAAAAAIIKTHREYYEVREAHIHIYNFFLAIILTQRERECVYVTTTNFSSAIIDDDPVPQEKV